MNDELREELLGFIEAWRDDAAQFRGMGNGVGVEVAVAYDECADELEAMLSRASHPAAGGPAALRAAADALELMRDSARMMPAPKLGQINWPYLADQADAALARLRAGGGGA